MYAVNGILFNHESPLRGETFVTRKVTRAVARIALGLQDCVYMGNIDARRDWGHAKDYVEAMWLMLQQDTPEDYVIATGVTTTVRDFITKAFLEIGVELEFSGKEEKETATVKNSTNPLYPVEKGKVVMRIDPNYYRPTEVDILIGDASKAKKNLGWEPTHNLDSIIKEMVAADIKLFSRDKYLQEGGHEIINYNEG
jgi:GDPmannose 4,6-dehydratase